MNLMISSVSKTKESSKRHQTLIDALRSTSCRLSDESVEYQWGHMGQCNAGHLIQTITGMSSFEIVQSLDFEMDEWSEHATDYCPESGCRVDDLFEEMQILGLTPQDIVRLENLSDRRVLENLEGGFRPLRRNVKEDVVLYMESFADLLERN